ncbi:MAG: O-methyltransferase [Chitinophagaceae bacterium]|nr:O-methyltransferase [Chitinophagaceae bacterium]
MNIIHPDIQHYAEYLTGPEDPLLTEIYEFTRQNQMPVNMLTGHLQGKFLSLLSCLLKPRRILEIGTFTGYSALCLAKGLSEDGVLFTLEKDEYTAQIAESFFKKSIFKDKIKLIFGDAATVIPTLEENWDMIYIDADKPSYIQYFNLVFPKLNKNGIILADNIFFHGEVLHKDNAGKNAKAIYAFNEFIRQKNDIEKIALTIRDGLYIIRKVNQ